MQQEALADLFSQNLNLSNQDPSTVQFTPQPTQGPMVMPKSSTPDPPQPSTFASTHYTQTAHLAPKRPAESPSMPLNRAELESIFRRNNIDSNYLLPSQISLFQSADNDQQLRLLELWRIAPPNYGLQAMRTARDLNAWSETSLQHEEALAKMRYEQRMQERQGGGMAVDGGMEDDGMEGVDGVVPVQAAVLESRQAEPYIVSGYEMLARRDYEDQANLLRESTRYNQATDPVFRGTGLWEKKDVQDMENQYGNFQQWREVDASGGFPAAHDDGMIF